MNAENRFALHNKFSVLIFLLVACFLLVTLRASAQSCLSANDMDASTRSALTATAQRYFDMAAKGDVFNLKLNSIPSLASNFTGIETAVIDNKAAFAGAQATPRPPFLLQAQGTNPNPRAEFLCGVFGSQGQTRDSAVFVIPNLPPGNYGVVVLDINGQKGPYTLTMVLQQMGNDWKLGGYYAKASEIAGHDAP
ncbi:MAG: hypothetical protein DMG68_09940, partial [Acidobacteria bacterium]